MTDRRKDDPASRQPDAEAAALAPAGPRQPAYDAVFAFIRGLGDALPAEPVHRNAMIWRAVHAGLDAMTAQTPPADRATLRDRIAEALMQWADGNNSPAYAAMRRSETVRANAYSRADVVLAVLPEPADRAAVLDEAADVAKRNAEAQFRFGETDMGRGARNVEDVLRRMAAEARATDTQDNEAHPPQHRWQVELLDGGEWMPTTRRHEEREQAVTQLQLASERHSTFSDGTPVQRRLVRETTTYTVETAPRPS
ncbi:hypothetical protein ABZX85_23220 [Streptomyces sp. NPDC004539]|uniref:hypothetical protein n=1 Tax=Streptomyces sp. NPDC004539 TaxID=3154280 RepID=UPI00339FDC41